MQAVRSGSEGGRARESQTSAKGKGWAALALLLLPLTAAAGPGSDYRWDESRNRPGPNRCRDSAQCDGARTCSPSGWCQGDARPMPPPRADRDRDHRGPDRRPDWDDVRTDRPIFIRSQLNGLVLDISGNNRASGAEVIAHPAKNRREGIDNQQWELVPTRGGYYIRSRLNGFVLDIWGLNRNAGAPVRVGEPNGGANQLWQLVPSHIRGYYFIQSNLNGYVLDIEGAKADGRLIAHPRKSSGLENQLWQLER
ncbi:RICIN domain-containing protein [Cystobacter ferrugineus]|uniref:Ricin B lectin domain-containing protein n=1 Tax=Cystobacter ferrugineus TaxID=83449 RepID=A0A1L9AUB3_9BACT|nr:RICIN domain-containing protein [Cystobacter ferrugineus]OJH33523.1 hypothetical protein BON30_48205 [Cystobacter ferrugineus]